MPQGTLEQQVLLDTSFEAAEDLSPYTFVKLNGDNKLVAAGDGETPIGLVTERWGDGEFADVVTDGVVPVKIGTAGTLSKDDAVAVDANGEVDAGSADDPVAAVLKAAPDADGDLVQARISIDIITAFQTI